MTWFISIYNRALEGSGGSKLSIPQQYSLLETSGVPIPHCLLIVKSIYSQPEHSDLLTFNPPPPFLPLVPRRHISWYKRSRVLPAEYGFTLYTCGEIPMLATVWALRTFSRLVAFAWVVAGCTTYWCMISSYMSTCTPSSHVLSSDILTHIDNHEPAQLKDWAQKIAVPPPGLRRLSYGEIQWQVLGDSR